MQVMVTGASGFVGSNLVRALVSLGYEVIATGSPSEQRLPTKGVRFFAHGLTGVNFPEIERSLPGQRLHILFHQAANNDTGCADEHEMMWANVAATKKLFDWAWRHGCRKIVYASSTAVYGMLPAPHCELGELNPLNLYAKSKVKMEQSAAVFTDMYKELTCVGLRYCNIYGPGESHKGKRASMIYQMGRTLTKGRPVRIFHDGEQKRDWIFIDDVVRANLLAMECGESCVVNCGSGKATSFNELNSTLLQTIPIGNAESCEMPEYIPNPNPAAYQSHTQCDMRLAEEKLGFVPRYDIRAGIEAYYKRGGFNDSGGSGG
jgi:ADP-L-glycero-D-manno-heptose 6-epimerase